MRKLILALMATAILSGCNDNPEIFGIKIGSDYNHLVRDGMIKKVSITPSSKNFILAEMKTVPNPVVGSSANYFVQSVDGKVVSISARIDGRDIKYYTNILSYAQGVMGEEIANNKEVKDNSAIKSTIYGCAESKKCADYEYGIFRKGKLNAMVSRNENYVNITFDEDEIKDALK